MTLDPSETRRITPGPGTYKAPSEFGFLETASTRPLQPSRSAVNLLQKQAKPTTTLLQTHSGNTALIKQIANVQKNIQEKQAHKADS